MTGSRPGARTSGEGSGGGRRSVGRQRFDQYAIAWLQAASLRPKTRAGYASLLDNHILIDLADNKPGLGQMTLAEIDPTAVKVWWADRLKRGAPTARARAYALLRTIMNEAIRDSAIQANPCTIRGASKTSHPERKPATVAQLNVIADHMPPRYRMLALVAAWSQARFGELTELRRGDVDLDRLTIRIDRAVSEVDRVGFVVGPPRGTDEGRRTIHLPGTLRADLVGHLEPFVRTEDDALVFGTRNRTSLSSRNVAVHEGRERGGRAAGHALPRPSAHRGDHRSTGGGDNQRAHVSDGSDDATGRADLPARGLRP
jgi:integrase